MLCREFVVVVADVDVRVLFKTRLVGAKAEQRGPSPSISIPLTSQMASPRNARPTALCSSGRNGLAPRRPPLAAAAEASASFRIAAAAAAAALAAAAAANVDSARSAVAMPRRRRSRHRADTVPDVACVRPPPAHAAHAEVDGERGCGARRCGSGGSGGRHIVAVGAAAAAAFISARGEPTTSTPSARSRLMDCFGTVYGDGPMVVDGFFLCLFFCWRGNHSLEITRRAQVCDISRCSLLSLPSHNHSVSTTKICMKP